MGPFIELIIECLHEKIDELREENELEENHDDQYLTNSQRIQEAMEEIGVKTDMQSPIHVIMKDKLDQRKRLEEVTYETWKEAYAGFLDQVKKIAEEFNAIGLPPYNSTSI